MKVLIVEDSLVFRSQIKNILSEVPFVEIVGTATNGKDALEILKKKKVDLLTLDLEMPEMNGVDTLKEMQRLGYKQKVIVFASINNAEAALEATRLGAIDIVAKPIGIKGGLEQAKKDIKDYLVPKITQFISLKMFPTKKFNNPTHPFKNSTVLSKDLIVIASSTGGPNALINIFSKLNDKLTCPICIVQHMPPVFTASLANNLARISGLKVIEAKHDDCLEPGCVYVCPGGYHMRLKKVGNIVKIQLDTGPLRNHIRPSADFLFETAAEIYKNKCLGIVLTGMGSDGRDGAVALKKANAQVIIQDRESSVVWGMARSVFEVGAYDSIETLDNIINIILKNKIKNKIAL